MSYCISKWNCKDNPLTLNRWYFGTVCPRCSSDYLTFKTFGYLYWNLDMIALSSMWLAMAVSSSPICGPCYWPVITLNLVYKHVPWCSVTLHVGQCEPLPQSLTSRPVFFKVLLERVWIKVFSFFDSTFREANSKTGKAWHNDSCISQSWRT